MVSYQSIINKQRKSYRTKMCSSFISVMENMGCFLEKFFGKKNKVYYLVVVFFKIKKLKFFFLHFQLYISFRKHFSCVFIWKNTEPCNLRNFQRQFQLHGLDPHYSFTEDHPWFKLIMNIIYFIITLNWLIWSNGHLKFEMLFISYSLIN